jgi:DnaJ-class molecular chaperone
MSKDIERCSSCNGTGGKRIHESFEGNHGRDSWRGVTVDCPRCEGSGLVLIETVITPFKPRGLMPK